ncbi:MAG: NAD(P)/FAD-dependent oxidoreductase, partial [Planctomycetaceae bacterium]|nr:NAD(P)/FAD-dependent oxidoreductase [Planctomycetaceae bacterium]
MLVIGTGPAASRVARKCADAGWSVAVAEKREYGGTCALRGCNPKKVFVRAAELLDWARRANGKLVHCENARINWTDLAGFKREFTQAIPEKSEQSFQTLGITTLHGTARFLDHQVVQVGETTVEARHILIATGAKPAPLEFKGHEHVACSSDFMNLEQLPSRILFLGGGYISFEFAHVAVRA